jgi:hypothetical protein
MKITTVARHPTTKICIRYFYFIGAIILLLFTIYSFSANQNKNFPIIIQSADAIGTWNGQDTLHVPMSWCPVSGSQAVSNPNVPVLPNSPVPTDTDTDSILWRRHERPTDNIFVNQAGITFRSAINSIWGTNLNFPVISDPNTAVATQGDVNGADPNLTELRQLINSCEQAWTNLASSGSGVLAVRALNVNLFHNDAGRYIGIIGYSGCAQSATTTPPPVTCFNPYDGFIAVADNHYLFPNIPNRNAPGTNSHFAFTDPFDQLVGHELGFALGLNEKSGPIALMNLRQRDNNNDGRVDNIDLDNTEVATLRSNALSVPGLERDPIGNIIKGDIVAASRADKIQENKSIPVHLDISLEKFSLNTKDNKVYFSQHLFGLIPNNVTDNLQYWTLIDTDNNTSTGAEENLLRSIGVPESKFTGVELAIQAQVNQGHKIIGSVWQFQEGALVPLPTNASSFDLLAMMIHQHYAGVADGSSNNSRIKIPLYNIISTTINNEFAKINLDNPFKLLAIAVGSSLMIDKLGDVVEERGAVFTPKYPLFAHCFPQSDARAGDTIKIELESLLPNSKIHGLLGPRPVFNGTTNSTGGGIIDFPIPNDVNKGLHLVTIGVDDTAFTADCVVNVVNRDLK